MRKIVFYAPSIFCMVIIFSCQESHKKITTSVLKNDFIEFVQKLEGGSISSLRLKNSDINPFDWSLPIENQPDFNGNGFAFEGHFISLGTWGMPSKGEQDSGIRLYGEPMAKIWEVDTLYNDPSGDQVVVTSFSSDIEGLDFKREVRLSKTAPILYVSESVTNTLPIGRPYNLLQHPTFGGSFVSKHLVIDTNADKGFYQKGNFPRDNYLNLEEHSFKWPNGEFPKDTIDLRKTGEFPHTFLTSHLFLKSDKLGWVTASNPDAKILVGYLWDTYEYPWLNVWHQSKNGEVIGRAVEFATCGLGLGFEELITTDYSYYDTLSFEYIDAKQTKTKSYYMFAFDITKDFIMVKNIKLQGQLLKINYLTNKGTVEKIIPVQNE